LLIWAINSGHTLEGSLGNYLNPLVYVILGMIFFRERLSLLQWAAFILAAISVIMLTVFSGKFPWVSIGLTFTFGFYGLIKKKVNAGSLENLGTETLLSVPVSIILLLIPGGGLNAIMSYDIKIWIILLFVGLVTTAPLYCFSRGAKYLPLSVMGFIQFITPTIHFGLGVFVFHESFPLHNLLAFILIWAAVILYCISYILPPKN
jgi:chloramphenicol-sensitive protein RarD